MALKELIEKLRGTREEKEELPDDMTRDKHLRSLRREDRVMDEEEEKEQLKKKIADRKRERVRKHLFGIKEDIAKKKLNNLKKKKVNVLSNEIRILGNNKKEVKKTGFLGKSNL